MLQPLLASECLIVKRSAQDFIRTFKTYRDHMGMQSLYSDPILPATWRLEAPQRRPLATTYLWPAAVLAGIHTCYRAQELCGLGFRSQGQPGYWLRFRDLVFMCGGDSED